VGRVEAQYSPGRSLGVEGVGTYHVERGVQIGGKNGNTGAVRGKSGHICTWEEYEYPEAVGPWKKWECITWKEEDHTHVQAVRICSYAGNSRNICRYKSQTEYNTG
jgi:hypothetical protein